MLATKNQQWLRVLTKGMVTLPKVWKQELGLMDGVMVQAYKDDHKIIIEPIEQVTSKQVVPYRVYSQTEINQLLQDDALSPQETVTIDKKLRAVRSA